MQENVVYIALWNHLGVKKKIRLRRAGGRGAGVVCGGPRAAEGGRPHPLIHRKVFTSLTVCLH